MEGDANGSEEVLEVDLRRNCFKGGRIGMIMLAGVVRTPHVAHLNLTAGSLL